jgi:hypothetical protein
MNMPTMQCGHLANAVTQDGKPLCLYCVRSVSVTNNTYNVQVSGKKSKVRSPLVEAVIAISSIVIGIFTSF